MVAPADDGIAVVIPAFQAAATVGAVVAATRRVLPDAGIYVVDDGSTDGTGAVGAGRGALAAIVLALPAHRGKGAALAAGIERAARDGAEVMVTLDADGQHDPGDIPRLLDPLAAGKADLVLGARPRTRRMPGALRAGRDDLRRGREPFPIDRRHVADRPCVRPLRWEHPDRGQMKILVSNDDGVLARGLELLADVCSTVGQVTVVAPDREQSGTSHSLTLHRPLRATRRQDGAFQVDGTPTDCVMLALGTLMPDKPDWVISGVNHGPNMGEDVLYSGTVAAAMEGLAAGIPSIAVSYGSFDLEHLESHREVLRGLIQRIVRVEGFPKETDRKSV